MYFHLKSLTALTVEDIEINLYGIYNDLTSPITKKTDVVFITHVADTVPAVLYHVDEMSRPYYSSIHYNNYYELEGSFTLRSSDLLNGDWL